MARSTARKRALNTLYEADEKGQDIPSLLAERILRPGAQTPLPDYAIDLVRGVSDHLRLIDSTLDEHSTGWKLSRMAVVDRNILRIAAWEIIYNLDVPERVAIDEALSLAKTLSDSDAPPFIHGLLSAVAVDREQALIDEASAKTAEREAAQAAETEAARNEEELDEATPTEEVQHQDSELDGFGADVERDAPAKVEDPTAAASPDCAEGVANESNATVGPTAELSETPEGEVSDMTNPADHAGSASALASADGENVEKG